MSVIGMDALQTKGLPPWNLLCSLVCQRDSRVLGEIELNLEEATWTETCKELHAGWMEIDQEEDQSAAWAMRFGLQQKDTVRVIEVFTIAGVNQSVGLPEKLKIFGIDDSAHSVDSARDHKHPKLLGKTIDLRHAYKQFGICARDRAKIRVATVDSNTRTVLALLVNALPFGATGSVAAFLGELSMPIWFLGVIGMGLTWTCFSDDFTLLSREDGCKVVEWSAECLLDLLGVEFA